MRTRTRAQAWLTDCLLSCFHHYDATQWKDFCCCSVGFFVPLVFAFVYLKTDGNNKRLYNWKRATRYYLDSVIIRSLVIVNPLLFIISMISPAFDTASGLMRANVLWGNKEWIRRWKQSYHFCLWFPVLISFIDISDISKLRKEKVC